MQNRNKITILIGSIVCVILLVVSFVFEWAAPLPSMYIILGLVSYMLIMTLDPLPVSHETNWKKIIKDIKNKKLHWYQWFNIFHTKVIFPAILGIYLILLILQRLTIVPDSWQPMVTTLLANNIFLWVTLGSAILANFPGMKNVDYSHEQISPAKNIGLLIFIVALAFIGAWWVSDETISLWKISYFVSLSTGALIMIVGVMILSEHENDDTKNYF